MGYYMRFLITDPGPLDLRVLGGDLSSSDPDYEARFDATGGTLFRADEPVAELELNIPGDGLFDDELGELETSAADGHGPGEARVAETLATAQAIVAVQVLFADSAEDGDLAALDPIWEWLFANRQGLLQADGEGYYDAHGLIFAVT
jgi:hypothetical protein